MRDQRPVSRAVIWTTRALILLLLSITALPLIPTGWWPIRLWDFPRLQILIVSSVLMLYMLALARHCRRKQGSSAFLAILLAVMLWQASYIIPYTSIWPHAVPGADSPDISLLICNLDKRNKEHEAVEQMLRQSESDVLILVELDQTWANALSRIRDDYEHRSEAVLEDGLGLAVWSRRPLHNAEIRYIISENRPSIFAQLEINAHRVHLVAIHPTPPALKQEHEEERYDSSIRDAELVLLAREVHEHPERNWIVAGDYNDVAWSRTTALFSRISGLRDPRVGRGLINTYHARYPLMRYPLDHVFVSRHFAVHSFERILTPGSDHFAVRVELAIVPPASASKQPDGDDAEAAAEIVEEGIEEAAEHNEMTADPGAESP